MCIIHILGLPIDWAFSLFVPGFFVVRRLTLDAKEKIACSIGASVFALYLYSFLLFILKAPSACHFLFTLGGMVLAWRCHNDLRSYFSNPDIRRLLLCFVAIVIWTGGLLALVRNYSGAGWIGDWFEHYQRAVFFLYHEPLNKSFGGQWVIPTRPPLFNLVASHFLAEWGDSFLVYQVSAMLLNLSIFFPASLFLRKIAPRLRSAPLALAILMALNPSVMENATYVWTKLLAASYVLLGLWFYFRSLEKRDALSPYFAFACVSIGILTHYLAAPYMVVLAVHYLYRRLREFRWKELSCVAALSVLILSTWFGWSLANYSPQATFGANIFVKDAPQYSLVHHFARTAGNIRDTLVPPFLRSNDPWQNLDLSWATFSNYIFLVYQANLLIAIGSVGWLIAIWQAFKLGRDAGEKGYLHFWAWFVLGSIVLGVAVVGQRDESGVAHLDLQPLVVLGVILVAAAWSTLPKPLRLLGILGLTCDFALGIALNFLRQYSSFPWSFASADSQINWQIKQVNHLIFLGDCWPASLLLVQTVVLGFLIYRLGRWRRVAGGGSAARLGRDLSQ